MSGMAQQKIWRYLVTPDYYAPRHVSYQHNDKMHEWIFMTFSGYVDHDIISNLEYFCDDAINPLDAGFIFILPGSLFEGNMTE